MALSVGIISDTHGLLRPEALAALEGSDLIVHAGDVGSPDVLDGLRRIAPTFAVRGNNDRGAWAEALAETEIVGAGDVLLYVIHDLAALDLACMPHQVTGLRADGAPSRRVLASPGSTTCPGRLRAP